MTPENYVPDPKTLKGLSEFAEYYARDMFEAHGGFPPVYFIVTPDDQLSLVHPMPYRNRPEKELSALIMRMMMRDLFVKRYVHVHEAWALRTSGQLPDDYDPNHDSIKDRPDRIETVMIIAEDHSRSTAHTIKITRDEKGNPSLGPMEKVDYTRAGGRHFGMLRRDA